MVVTYLKCYLASLDKWIVDLFLIFIVLSKYILDGIERVYSDVIIAREVF